MGQGYYFFSRENSLLFEQFYSQNIAGGDAKLSKMDALFPTYLTNLEIETYLDL